MDYLGGVLFVIAVFVVSVALHEVGHLVPAKRYGVRVSQYMVGFGPTLWSRTVGETEYGLKAVLLGGYVRIVGMYPTSTAVGSPRVRGWWSRQAASAREASAEDIPPGEEGRAFYHLSARRKLVVMLGGPLMNLLIAIVLLLVVLLGFGAPGVGLTVSSVSECVLPATAPADARCTEDDPPAPAAAAGLRPGDTIVTFGGEPVGSWDEVQTLIRASGAEPVTIGVKRDGAVLDLEATPVVAARPVLDQTPDESGAVEMVRVGFLGVSPAWELQPVALSSIPETLADRLWLTAKAVATFPVKVADVVITTFTGQERDVDSIIGPVGVGRIAGEIASTEQVDDPALRVTSLLELAAAVNLSLFVFNLIPVVPLDGGHVVAAVWEGLRKRVARRRGLPTRPVDTSQLVPVAYVVAIGIMVVGALLAYADLVNPVLIG